MSKGEKFKINVHYIHNKIFYQWKPIIHHKNYYPFRYFQINFIQLVKRQTNLQVWRSKDLNIGKLDQMPGKLFLVEFKSVVVLILASYR